jgi:hypothetical protein
MPLPAWQKVLDYVKTDSTYSSGESFLSTYTCETHNGWFPPDPTFVSQDASNVTFHVTLTSDQVAQGLTGLKDSLCQSDGLATIKQDYEYSSQPDQIDQDIQIARQGQASSTSTTQAPPLATTQPPPPSTTSSTLPPATGTGAGDVTVTGCSPSNVAPNVIDVSGRIVNHSAQTSNYAITVNLMEGSLRVGGTSDFESNIAAGQTSTWSSVGSITDGHGGRVTCQLVNVDRNPSNP